MPNSRWSQFYDAPYGYPNAGGSVTTQRCCGVLSNWSQCTNDPQGGQACYSHSGQARWLRATHLSASHRIAHAKERRCSGLIKDNSRLCNNRVAGPPFQFCWIHGDHAPPSWSIPSSLPPSNDAQHVKLRSMFLDLVCGKLGAARPSEQSEGREGYTSGAQNQEGQSWYDFFFNSQGRTSGSSFKFTGARSSSYGTGTGLFGQTRSQTTPDSERVRQEEEARQRRDEADARRRQEEAERTRRQAEEDRRRRQREEQERQRQRQEEQERRRRQQQQQREDQRPAQSAPRYSTRTERLAPVHTAHAKYTEGLSTFRSSLKTPDARRVYTFADIPWPTRILEQTVHNVTPDKVQEFFVALKNHVSSETMKDELKLAQRFFHPDRFSGLGVYTKLRWKAKELEAVKLKVVEVSQRLNVLMTIVKDGRQFY
ncbi:hypothetical protein DL96DRAFT_1821167 [Flagelloscypha sp. PMI_526]|nr:hypothetical protein DL96DRAFT_1821167 [Flagelloscypha sp. PMI_526]